MNAKWFVQRNIAVQEGLSCNIYNIYNLKQNDLYNIGKKKKKQKIQKHFTRVPLLAPHVDQA